MLGARDGDPTPGEVVDELAWVMDRAVEHLGADRGGRYLRKFYPWYVERLGLEPAAQKSLQEALQRTSTVEEAHAVIHRSSTLQPV
jgi:hypothetical protein